MTSAKTLRQLLAKPGTIADPAVYDCLGSKLAEKAGFSFMG